MDPEVRALIEQIHAAPSKAALALTGGGASAAGWLLAVPGGSRTVLEVSVPYAQAAFAEYLGREPAAYCSEAVACDLAVRARERAARLAPGDRVAGVGCTASLRSDRPKRGEHRVHVGLAGETGVAVHSLTLAKERREREGEEEVAARMVVNALAEAFALPGRLTLPLLTDEAVVRTEEPAGLLVRFLRGEQARVCVGPDGRWSADAPPPGVLLPGSFNPLHEGHRGMAAAAAAVVGRPAAFELSGVNVEKPPLTEGELRRRLTQFAWRAPVWLTRAPTFLDKARLFPGTVFVVGADTAARVVEPRFYGGSADAMRAALAEVRALGGRFLVCGRLLNGTFVRLDQLGVAEFGDLFREVPEEVFRADVSSTQLRSAGNGGRGG
jgi:hypothetical protein